MQRWEYLRLFLYLNESAAPEYNYVSIYPRENVDSDWLQREFNNCTVNEQEYAVLLHATPYLIKHKDRRSILLKVFHDLYLIFGQMGWEPYNASGEWHIFFKRPIQEDP